LACQRLTRSLFIIFLRAKIRKDPAIATADQNAAASPLPLPADTRDSLIDRLASYLAPFFDTNPHDMPAAHLTAVRAIASYQPETQADCINIARSISFSMSALAALRRAAAEEMPPALQLRYFGGANSLNRSADQSERMMERRRRYQQACASPVPPAWTAGSAAGAAAVAREGGDCARQEIDDARLAERSAIDSGIGDAEITELEVGEAAIEAAVAEAMLKYTIGCKPGSAVGAATGNPLTPKDMSAGCLSGVSPAASKLHRGVMPAAHLVGDPRFSQHSAASRGSPCPTRW
jgi:hypothetical protein